MRVVQSSSGSSSLTTSVLGLDCLFLKTKAIACDPSKYPCQFISATHPNVPEIFKFPASLWEPKLSQTIFPSLHSIVLFIYGLSQGLISCSLYPCGPNAKTVWNFIWNPQHYSTINFPLRVFSPNSYLIISVDYTQLRILYQSCDLKSHNASPCLLAVTTNLFWMGEVVKKNIRYSLSQNFRQPGRGSSEVYYKYSPRAIRL